MKRLFAPALLALALLAAPAQALAPGEIWIVVNKNVPDSQAVADYYCLKRGVPKSNVLALDMTSNEEVSRASYDVSIMKPLRAALGPKKDKVKLILTTYGVPLIVGPTSPTAAELAELKTLLPKIDGWVKQQTDVNAQVAALVPKAKTDANAAKQLAALYAQLGQIATQLTILRARQGWLMHGDSTASVDSELANLFVITDEYRSYQLSPLYFRVTAAQARLLHPAVMTCRLDGLNVKIVKGLIDQAVAVEAKGLSGTAYVDARGLRFDLKSDPRGVDYGAYDESLRETALLFSKSKFKTVLDNKPALFAPNSCPDCAIYCGWYSAGRYVASNKFAPGAVGYHIASDEATTLRRPNSNVWCKRLLEDGIAATLGPVQEPYLFGFPRPAEFFGFLGTGMTLAESYWASNKYTSWKMALVGDPLYRPFAKSPLWKIDAVRPSPLGVK